MYLSLMLTLLSLVPILGGKTYLQSVLNHLKLIVQNLKVILIRSYLCLFDNKHRVQ
jgi:hypothetical protein